MPQVAMKASEAELVALRASLAQQGQALGAAQREADAHARQARAAKQGLDTQVQEAAGALRKVRPSVPLGPRAAVLSCEGCLAGWLQRLQVGRKRVGLSHSAVPAEPPGLCQTRGASLLAPQNHPEPAAPAQGHACDAVHSTEGQPEAAIRLTRP